VTLGDGARNGMSAIGQELTLALWIALSKHAQALNRSKSGILVLTPRESCAVSLEYVGGLHRVARSLRHFAVEVCEQARRAEF